MKIFTLGLPHTKSTSQFSSCAFTQKVRKLCKMMTERGHQVIHLGTEGSDPICSENVVVTPADQFEKLYGHPGTGFFHFETDGKYKPYSDMYVRNVRKEILKRCNRDYESIICIPWGGLQFTATEGLKQFVVESGIGYPHPRLSYRVYESYAWMHYHLGKEGRSQGGAWYETVIPNSFEPDEFVFGENPKDYFVYLGRLIDSKGVDIAGEVAERLGKRLIICGQGDPKPFLKRKGVEYLPPVGPEARKKLLSEAYALIHPTIYVEPFGGVVVEAMLSGCPVITTDWGAFTETVVHGHTGYRCRTFEQFLWAARNIGNIDRKTCRDWALNNYTPERIAPMYEEFFQQILNLQDKGWYQLNKSRADMSFLTPALPGNPKPEYRSHIDVPMTNKWETAQKFEKNWWYSDPESKRWEAEVKKQETYMRLMGLERLYGDLKVLDIGGGPIPMISTQYLMEPNDGSIHCTVIDPLPIKKSNNPRWNPSGSQTVKFVQMKAEDFTTDVVFDEAWVYNCLMHTERPGDALRAALNNAKVVRIFEWINEGGKDPGHPNNLTEEWFDAQFDSSWKREIWNRGFCKGLGGTNTDEYLAIVARKIDPET